MRKRTQKGFTLVELVVVIVILGILAAVALPRFVGLQGDARYAKLQAVAGSMKAASAMAHAAFLVKEAGNTTGTPTASVTIEGSVVALTFGYPAVGATGITIGANLSEIDGITIAGTTTTTVTINGGASTCVVTYTPATSATVPPLISLPTSTTAAC